jgi:6-methylsalicylate decarboxylase
MTPVFRDLIDVHQHFLPPDYIQAVGESAIAKPAPSGQMPEWNSGRALELMEATSIRTAFLSISAPGIVCDQQREANRLARLCNLSASGICTAHPDRFGMFAALPLPDSAAARSEAAFAFDTLGADGVALMTNHRGAYLGDPSYSPLFDMLNERAAVVFVHPTASGNPLVHPAEVASTLDFPFDTARTILSLLYSRAFVRWPSIRFIFTHAGGVFPFLLERVARAARISPQLKDSGPIDVSGELSRAWFDTTSSTNPATFECLRGVLPFDRILFGTDFPFVPAGTTESAIRNLSQLNLTASERSHLSFGNALSLFPRLQQGSTPHHLADKDYRNNG